MTLRASKPSFNVREKLTELAVKFGLKGSELAKAETVQDARDLVSAGRKNMIINGDMRISQRATSVSASNNSYNTLDRWNTWINYNSGGVTMSQASAAPPGFYKSLQFYNNGNATTPQYHFVEQKIEAQNIPQLKMGTNDAEYMTLSFWVRSSRTGTFNVEFSDDDGSHHAVKKYTINNAATWEYKTITIPPATNTGVPTYDNTVGLTVHWWLAGSGSYNGTSADGTWQTYSTTRRNDGGNTTFTDPDYWNITGVQLEVGKNATDFEHRPYGEELALCQRYYQKIYYNTSDYPFGYCYTYNVSASACVVPLVTSMRGEASSIDVVNCNIRGSNQDGVNNGYTVTSHTYATDNGITKGLCQLNLGHNSVNSTNIGSASILTNGVNNATSYIAIDAEL